MLIILLFISIANHNLAYSTKKLHGHHVHLVEQEKEEDYLKEHEQRPIMKIHEECDEKFLKKILKSFEYYFDIY